MVHDPGETYITNPDRMPFISLILNPAESAVLSAGSNLIMGVTVPYLRLCTCIGRLSCFLCALDIYIAVALHASAGRNQFADDNVFF